MNYEEMTKEELAKELRALNDYMENIVVFWGDKKGFRTMFEEVARNDGIFLLYRNVDSGGAEEKRAVVHSFKAVLD